MPSSTAPRAAATSAAALRRGPDRRIGTQQRPIHLVVQAAHPSENRCVVCVTSRAAAQRDVGIRTPLAHERGQHRVVRGEGRRVASGPPEPEHLRHRTRLRTWTELGHDVTEPPSAQRRRRREQGVEEREVEVLAHRRGGDGLHGHAGRLDGMRTRARHTSPGTKPASAGRRMPSSSSRSTNAWSTWAIAARSVAVAGPKEAATALGSRSCHRMHAGPEPGTSGGAEAHRFEEWGGDALASLAHAGRDHGDHHRAGTLDDDVQRRLIASSSAGHISARWRPRHGGLFLAPRSRKVSLCRHG